MKAFIVILTMGLSGAIAENCYSPWAWCGWDLVKRGKSTASQYNICSNVLIVL